MGLTWRLREDWLPAPQGWTDPTGRMPVWSTMDFRRVAVELPQHRLSHLVAEADGRPVLLAPVLRSPGPGGLLFYDVPAMIGDGRAFGVDVPVLAEPDRAALYPSIAVGMHGAYHGILVAEDCAPALRVELFGELLGAVGDLARELGCASSALLYATPDLIRLLRPDPGHLLAVLGAEASLSSRAGDFTGYLAELTSRRRGRALRERRMYLAGPACSRISTGPDALGADLVDLRCNLRRRYGLPEHRERTEAEFAALARHCGDRLVVNRSLLDGDTVGFVVNLRHGDTLYSRTAGFDYGRLGSRDFCYFNIVYYDMLDWGLPRGVRSLELGMASYPGKRTRGAVFEPRYGVFALPPGSPALALLAAQEDTEWTRLAAECGDGLDTRGGRPWT
jgi:uncharacterized protein